MKYRYLDGHGASHPDHCHGETLFRSKSKETRADGKGEDLEIGEDFPIKEISGMGTKDWKPQKPDISSSPRHQLMKNERRSPKICGAGKRRKEDVVESKNEEWRIKKIGGELLETIKIRCVLKQNKISQK